MKILAKLVFVGLCAFVLLQLVRPGISAGPSTAEIQAPLQVRQILRKDCYACHSDERRLAWFDEVVPAYWLVRHDIVRARKHLDFSTLGSKPAAVQKATLFEAVNMIQLGAMPLPQFVALHPDAKVTPRELATLKAYLAPWTLPSIQGSPARQNGKAKTSPSTVAAEVSAPMDLAAVRQEFNGLAFESGFESWKPISFTDRGDNNTFRFILGNDVAVRAAQTGNIFPWPDGARFAKIAWQQEPGTDGLIYPGKFVQVELMVKDAGRYKRTDGWGWGRWRGMDLKPYGSNGHFASECTSCHEPVRGDDFVYTLPISQAHVTRPEAVNTRAAAFPLGLPYQPLEWGAITMFVDPASRSMATVYGNAVAMHGVRARGTAFAQRPAYAPGAVLALVTWAQREDPHWFGGRISDTPRSIEFVVTGAEGKDSSYRCFEGPKLLEVTSSPEIAARRSKFILGLHPAALP